MLNLSKFFTKSEIIATNEIKNEYSDRLLLKALHSVYQNTKLNIVLDNLNGILNKRLTIHPLDIIGCYYVMDKIDEDDIINIIINGNYDNINTIFPEILNTPSPRDIITFDIIDNLYSYKEYKDNITLLINTAIDIEKSCYNAIIGICRQSDDPPTRNWKSPLFVEYYSSRCGTISRLLSLDSQSVKEYGCVLVNKLLSGEIDPAKVGFMNESEICPQSQELERMNIEKRMGQKIEEKISDLYACPSCKQRRCSYITVQQRRSLDEAADIIYKCLNPECLIVFRVK